MSKIINDYEHLPYQGVPFTEKEALERTAALYEFVKRRRSIRSYSNKPIERKIIENILKTASTAPSGANKQPWTFVAISNPDLKAKIREAVEEEEFKSYNGRMSERWLEDLEQFGTNHLKPFIEVAPWIIVVFKKVYDISADGQKENNYYVNESVGIASGFLINAIHHAGLVTLTHTPSPMNFLHKILDRPSNEKPFLLLPVGYPAKDAHVPKIIKKSLEDYSVFID